MSGHLKEQELSNIVWSLGRAGVHDSALMGELVAACTARLSSFMPQVKAVASLLITGGRQEQ